MFRSPDKVEMRLIQCQEGVVWVISVAPEIARRLHALEPFDAHEEVLRFAELYPLPITTRSEIVRQAKRG